MPACKCFYILGWRAPHPATPSTTPRATRRTGAQGWGTASDGGWSASPPPPLPGAASSSLGAQIAPAAAHRVRRVEGRLGEAPWCAKLGAKLRQVKSTSIALSRRWLGRSGPSAAAVAASVASTVAGAPALPGPAPPGRLRHLGMSQEGPRAAPGPGQGGQVDEVTETGSE